MVGARGSNIPKNVVLILADQMRADITYHEKYGFVQTPHLDRLAEGGTRFTSAFCQSPVCGPSRAAMLTGRYPQQNGVTNNRCLLEAGERTIGHHLRDHGFHAAAFGKTHGQNPGFTFAAEPPLVPSLGTSTWGPVKKPPADKKESNRRIEPLVGVFEGTTEEHFDFVVARQAADYVSARTDDERFFLFVGLHGPHPPFLPPREFADLYRPEQIDLPSVDGESGSRPAFQTAYRKSWQSLSADEQRAMTVAYLAQISHVDAATGLILDAIDAAGRAQDTVVVFSADHGEQLGEHGLIGKFNNFYDASARCPLIMRAPGTGTPGTTTAGIVEHADVYPTICELLGIPIPNRVSGRSFTSLLVDPETDHREFATCFLESKPVHEIAAEETVPFVRGMMIRTGEWKLNLYNNDSAELYHVRTDSNELHNRIDDDSAQATRLALTELLASRSLDLVRNPTLWQLNQFAG